jgi:cyclopropane-fatty-acyl-phospholipid synthase
MSHGEPNGMTEMTAGEPARSATQARRASRGTGSGLVTRIARASALKALGRWQVGRLTVHLPDGAVHVGGVAEAEPHSTLWIEHHDFFRQLALRGDLGVGESYMDGDWRTDDLGRFLEIGILNQAALPLATTLSKLANLPAALLHALRRNTRRGSRRNIREHYDLSNELFALFLDPSMTYSSAIFAHADEPLDAAQVRKFQRFGERLSIGPADHLLEIGCGWGAFAIHAARTWGCRVTGITISQRQYDFARARVRDAGLEDRITLRLCDYRDLGGRFDKIVSIEMLEAVGRDYWPLFFRTCDAVLAPGGAIGIQTIAMPDHRFDEYQRHGDWIQKYIFPGGLLPSLSELCQAMARHTALGVTALEDIGPHYAVTLARWRAAFFENLESVQALGFDDRFVRMWEFYLASCEAMFRTGMLATLQLVLQRRR